MTYHHIELNAHDVVLIGESPAETFLDTVNRIAFAAGHDAVQLHPIFDRGGSAPL